MSVNHYENFPVASVLLPAELRPAVIRLYRFARAADDIADEGEQSTTERKEALGRFRQALTAITENPGIASLGEPDIDAIFVPLGQTIIRHRLPVQPLMDLLCAFEQDTQVHRYRTEEMLLDYCRRSANPVGRLMLHLFKQTDEASLEQSDAICTALQRINFLQDVALDWRKGRVYLPESAMLEAGVSIEHIKEARCDVSWQRLMNSQIQLCRDLMQRGEPLGQTLKGRVGLEIRLIIQGGLRILEKIQAHDGDVFRHRPALNRSDWLRLVWRAI
jgi:squalene synthase HpnC